jgi:hypothetical protein
MSNQERNPRPAVCVAPASGKSRRQVSDVLQRALSDMSERAKHPRAQNSVVESANGYLIVTTTRG